MSPSLSRVGVSINLCRRFIPPYSPLRFVKSCDACVITLFIVHVMLDIGLELPDVQSNVSVVFPLAIILLFPVMVVVRGLTKMIFF
jgi:hypothetical protein